MATIYCQVNEPDPLKRTVGFHLVGTDGMTPATGEYGEQPQIKVNNGAWTNTGISVLDEATNGDYTAIVALTQVAVECTIRTRYKSGSTAECPGDTLIVRNITPGGIARL